MNVMASIQNAVKNYRELPEKALAFDWGVEQFCKEAGFDADDTILMLAMCPVSGKPRTVISLLF